jgi:D-alanine-D-alanine ligase
MPLDEAIGSLRGAYPALIKPAHGDGSVGITRDAVVHTDAEARRGLARFREMLPGRAALLQEYLPGAEFGLALIGNPRHSEVDRGFVALPPLHVDFSALDPGCPPILSFESKTGPDNPYSAVRVIQADLPEGTIAQMRSWAELLFERLECRDYARFDFRTGADRVVKLMEINPNPAWSVAAKMALMARFGGITYLELLAMILDAARARLDL